MKYIPDRSDAATLVGVATFVGGVAMLSRAAGLMVLGLFVAALGVAVGVLDARRR